MNKRTGKVVFGITLIVIFAKCLGLLRELMLSNYYGASYITDAYLSAQSIVGLFFGWMSVIGTSYIPCYFKVKINGGADSATNFTSTIITIAILGAIVCFIIGKEIIPYLVSVSAPGYTGELKKLTIHFSKEYLPVLFTWVPSSILVAFLESNGRNLCAQFSTLVVSVGNCGTVILSTFLGPEVLVKGIVAVQYLQCVVLFVMAFVATGYLFKPILRISEEVKHLFRLTIPNFANLMLGDINSFIDKVFASYFMVGAITGLSYAHLLRRFFLMLLMTAVTSILYPKLADYITRKEYQKAVIVLSECLHLELVVAIPITVLLIFGAKDIIELLFLRGSFDQTAFTLTYYPFIMYIGALSVELIAGLCTPVIYALYLNKKLVRISIAAIVINILCDYALGKIWKSAGLALATTLSEAVKSVLLLYILQHSLEGFKMNKIGIVIAKLFIAILPAMGIMSFYTILFSSVFALKTRLLIDIPIVMISVSLYLLMLYFLKDEEIRKVVLYLRRRQC